MRDCVILLNMYLAIFNIVRYDTGKYGPEKTLRSAFGQFSRNTFSAKMFCQRYLTRRLILE